jgi:hypothetical protein
VPAVLQRRDGEELENGPLDILDRHGPAWRLTSGQRQRLIEPRALRPRRWPASPRRWSISSQRALTVCAAHSPCCVRV